MIGKLKEISLQKKEIANQQNGIIGEYLERFEKGEERLNEQAAEKLYALLVSLFPEKTSCMDPPVCLRLCGLLYDFYHEKGNKERGAFVIGYGALCELLLSLDLEEYDFFRFPRLCEDYFQVFGELSQAAQDEMEYLQGGEVRKVLLGFNLLIMRYFLGQLSFEDFLKKLDEAAEMDEQKGLGGMIYLTAHTLYLDYLHYCSPYDAERDEALARQRIGEVMPRILELKKQNELQFANQILCFINSTSLFGNFDDFYETVLAFTVYADKALYVHTVMVKEICHLLLERMLEDLIGEFMEMGGSRYSRRVAEILSEPRIKERVAMILTKGREEVNYQVYAKFKAGTPMTDTISRA